MNEYNIAIIGGGLMAGGLMSVGSHNGLTTQSLIRQTIDTILRTCKATNCVLESRYKSNGEFYLEFLAGVPTHFFTPAGLYRIEDAQELTVPQLEFKRYFELEKQDVASTRTVYRSMNKNKGVAPKTSVVYKIQFLEK